MFPWLWLYAPRLYFPWSGSVAQQIEPNMDWFFDSINADAGDGKIEKKAFDEASYGTQLGLLTKVLVELADKQAPLSPKAAESLDRLKDIQLKIDNIKKDQASSLAHSIEEQVRQFQKSNPVEFARLGDRLRGILGEGQ